MTQLDLRVTTLNVSGGQKAYEDSPNGTRPIPPASAEPAGERN